MERRCSGTSAPRLLAFTLLLACGDDAPASDAGPRDAFVAPADAGVDAFVEPDDCHATPEDHPTPNAGVCEPVIVDPEATLVAGTETVDEGETVTVIPGGRRVRAVGRQLRLPGFPLALAPIPGTRFAVVSDGAVKTEQLSVVNIDTLEVTDSRTFRGQNAATFIGLAARADGSEFFVSGGGTSEILRYGIDAGGTLSEGEPITVATDVAEGYVGGLALSSDESFLAAPLLFGSALAIIDLSTGVETMRIELPSASYPYDVVLSADDTQAFVTLWGGRAVAAIDLETGEVLERIRTGKNPSSLALSADGSTLAVADADSDRVSLIDVGTRALREARYVAGEDALRGVSPVAARFGPEGRLYLVSAGQNAVEVYASADDGAAHLGRIPTMWHPTDLRVLADGTILILNGRHLGTGANVNPDEDDIQDLVGGSLQVLDPGSFDDDDLARWAITTRTEFERGARFVEVDCGEDMPSDFPIPRPGEGASRQIRHVVLVVRENKTYDAYYGDLRDAADAAHGNGDPALTIIPTADIEDVLPNTRALAREFGLGDNYYSLAEASIQGHMRTTLGRTTDFIERSYLTTWGRAYWQEGRGSTGLGLPPQGIETIGYPEEGSAFDHLVRADVEVNNFGEIVSSRNAPPDTDYPGIVYEMAIPDVEKITWVVGQVQDECELASFTYILIPNDHTYGRQAGRPTPAAMIADNDAALGLLIDGLSHSTYWPQTAVFVIEDDPQDGGDHVDNHRSGLQVISPWARRRHVSSVAYDESSLWRTIQLILGVAEPLNDRWAAAAPLYDFFSATPDYTPYDAIPRRWPEEVNAALPADDPMAAEAAQWDFSEPDEQPGLSRHLWRHFHGAPAPWQTPIADFEIEEDEDRD